MGAANIWGLVLLITFMGYGMIEFPRTVWHSANTERRLTYYEYRASLVTLQLDEVEEELIEQLNVRKSSSTSPPFFHLILAFNLPFLLFRE